MNYNSSLKPSSIKSSCGQYKIYLQNENLVYESLKTDVNSIVTDSSSSGEAIKAFKDKVLNYSAIIATLIEANNLDIMEADSFIELVGDEVLDGITIIQGQRSAKSEYDRYRGEASSCYEKAYKATSVEMANHWRSEGSHYDGLASSAYQTYDFYLKKEKKYDEINTASALLFQKSSGLRTAAKNLMDLLSEGASDEDINKSRQDLKNAYDSYADYAFKDNAFATDSSETLWEYTEKEFDKSTEVGKNLSDLYEQKDALEKAMEQDPNNRNWYLARIAILEGNIQHWTEYGLNSADHTEDFSFVYDNCLDGYSEEERLKIVSYWMSVDKDGDLTGKEMPKWWMDEHLTIPRDLQVTEDDVVDTFYDISPEGKKARLCEYYYSSYFLVDCISGMGEQTDSLGPIDSERVRSMYSNREIEPDNSFNLWYDYMYGAMYDYTEGIESVRGAKYIFENKFGWGNNKSKVGVYNTLTNDPTGLYECEYYAYLTKFGHMDDYINNGNVFDAKTNREMQLFKYIREDGNYNSTGIYLKSNEKMIIQAAYDNDKNGDMPIASYKEEDIVIRELQDKLKETVFADYEGNIDVKIDGNKVIITYKGGDGKHGPDEAPGYTYTFELNESVNAFGGRYISQKEYMKCIQDFSAWRFDNGYIEKDMVDYFRYEADQTLRKTFGDEAVNDLISSNPEDYEKIIQAQVRNTYANDVLVDTFLDVERDVDKSMEKIKAAKSALGIAALVASIACPGTQAAALLLIGDGAFGIYEGSVKIYQGDVEGGVIEIGFSAFEAIGGLKSLKEINSIGKSASNMADDAAKHVDDLTDDVADHVDDFADDAENAVSDVANTAKQNSSETSSFDNFNPDNANNTNKCNFGEYKADYNLQNNEKITDAGYELESIGRDAPSSLDDKIVKGIDGLYKNTNSQSNIKYVIDEAKFGQSQLSRNTLDGMQMSENWLFGRQTNNNRILQAVGGDRALAKEIEKAFNRGEVARILSKVDSNGIVKTFLLEEKNGIVSILREWP